MLRLVPEFNTVRSLYNAVLYNAGSLLRGRYFPPNLTIVVKIAQGSLVRHRPNPVLQCLISNS